MTHASESALRLPGGLSWGEWRGACAAVAKAQAFTARNIANALWALAKMMHNPGERFLNTMGAEVAKKVMDFNAQNHANTVWAFATLGMCPAITPAVVDPAAPQYFLTSLFIYAHVCVCHACEWSFAIDASFQ